MSCIFLYRSDAEYCLRINFVTPHPKLNDYYYGYCASLNELLNTFYYARGELTSENIASQAWIFILRDINNRRADTKALPLNRIVDVNLEDICSFGKALHSLRFTLRNQLKLEIALYHQKHRLALTTDINRQRCAQDSRFISESLVTTNRIHRQRVKNLQEKIDKIQNRVQSIADIVNKLEWFIFIESSIISNTPALALLPKKPCTDIISKAWETLTELDQEKDVINDCTTL